MKSSASVQRFLPLGVAVVALVALVADGFIRGLAKDSQTSLLALPLMGLVGLGASLYRPRGVPTLAAGACIVPVAIGMFGEFVAALLALVILLLRQSIFWSLEYRTSTGDQSAKNALAFVLALGPLTLAVLAAGWVGIGQPHELAQRAAAGAVYLGFLGVLTILARSAEPGVTAWWLRWRQLTPLLLDALGWNLGLVLAGVVRAFGWNLGLVLGGGIAVLSALAAHSQLGWRRERRISDRLREVHLAGHRIIFRQPDLLTIARQIHAECRQVVSFSWFEFELEAPDGSVRAWWSGPDGGVEEGTAEPPDAPPKMPGLRRRAVWRVVRRDLATSERKLGRIKLWCDPRQVEKSAVDWLDAFLPEVSSSIERAFLSREARRDPLTDLPDRRVLESRLVEVFAQCREAGLPMAVIMADLDHFKRINDRHGHAIGDRALVEAARVLEKQRRESDVCCRFGGEEFALVLEDADGETAMAIAERIRRAMENTIFVPGGKKVPLRLSAGVASSPELYVREGQELIELADAALYEAKRQGRNRCFLNLGKGRFRDASGDVLDPEKPEPEIRLPTLFA